MTSSVHELRLFDLEIDGPYSRAPSSSRPDGAHTSDVAEAAIILRQSEFRLAAAVKAARRRGWSWRRIGAESGLPFQTLHRRFGDKRREGHTSAVD